MVVLPDVHTLNLQQIALTIAAIMLRVFRGEILYVMPLNRFS